MFRFTIRELVLLTLVVGLALGWWLDRASLQSARESDADFYMKREREWNEANRWWQDAKDTWRMERRASRS
jgi:hypothetical protein